MHAACDQKFAKEVWQSFYLPVFTFDLRDEDSWIKHLSRLPFGEFLVSQNIHLQHYAKALYLMYSNIAVTLIEQSHIIKLLKIKSVDYKFSRIQVEKQEMLWNYSTAYWTKLSYSMVCSILNLKMKWGQ